MRKAKKKGSTKSIQYAALPYRRGEDAHTQIMLVTSRETGRWVIPKGWPQKRRSPQASAAREAREEAGVVGRIGKDPIGSYSYEKRLKTGAVVTCEVRVFPLQVKRQQKRWPERDERSVQWFSRTGAARAVQESALKSIIRSSPKLR